MPVTERVRKDKSGKRIVRYEAEIYVRGVRLACQRFDTKAAAHTWHDETKKRLEVGQQDPSSVMTLGEVVVAYQESPFKELRKSSQQARASRFRYLIEAPFSTVLMREFLPKHIDEWLKWLRVHETAKLGKRQTFLQELKLLSVVLNWYRNEHDHLFTVPIVRRHYKAAHFKPVPIRQQDYYMKPEEVIVWLDHLRKRPDPVYYNIALLMVLTGLRMGEAAGLCWDSVELPNDNKGLLRVLRTMSWDYRTKEAYLQNEAKNGGSIRTVPIEGAVVGMLKALQNSGSPFSATSPIFLTKRGRYLRDNTIRDNFNHAFAACDLNWTGTHIARHTFATLALISERDLGAVQAALGHTNQRVTAGYAKVIALQSSKVTGNVARMIGMGGGGSR